MRKPQFATRMNLIQPNAVGELLKFGADPHVMSFAGGYPGATLFPAAALNAVYSKASWPAFSVFARFITPLGPTGFSNGACKVSVVFGGKTIAPR
jgi:hypothetical protein